jgi:hypothetical protein
MPCAGPSEYEMRAMEADTNMRRFGKKWSDHEMVDNVACALTAFIRHATPIPEWANRWMDNHEQHDREREQARENAKKEEQDKKLRQYKRLKKELGL